MRNYSIRDTTLISGGGFLEQIAATVLDKRNEYYVIGTENEIIDFYKKMGKYVLGIKAFCVTNKHITDLSGVQVISKRDICVDEYVIVICTAREREEYEREKFAWQEKGLMENLQFIHAELFSMLYDVYEREQIRIDRIEIFLTSRCTLNCEKCIAYIPYISKRVDVPLEQLIQDADILFGKVDYVYKLKLLGGEGLLYPYLMEYIDYLYNNYGDKIGTIRVGTNGTILPGQDILDMCKRDNVIMDVSDYSVAVPQISKIEEVRRLCEENGVQIDVKRTGEQWLDLGFPDNTPDKKDEEKLRDRFFKCAMFCRQFSKGKMWFCCANYSAVYAGLFPENENDYFDFHREFSKKELLQYEVGLSKLGHTTFCSVCRGCSVEANSCYVEVAKQKVRSV